MKAHFACLPFGLAATLLIGCAGAGTSNSSQGRAFGADPLGMGSQSARGNVANANAANHEQQVVARVMLVSLWPEGELEPATAAFERALQTAAEMQPRPSAIVVVDPSAAARIGGTVAKEREAWSAWTARFVEGQWQDQTLLIPVPHVRPSDMRAQEIAQWFHDIRPKPAEPTALEERDEPLPWNGVIPFGPRSLFVAEYVEKESPEAIAIELGTAAEAKPAERSPHRIYTQAPKSPPAKTMVLPLRSGREPAVVVLSAYADGRVTSMRGDLLGPAIDRLPKDRERVAPLGKEEEWLKATPPPQRAEGGSKTASGGKAGAR